MARGDKRTTKSPKLTIVLSVLLVALALPGCHTARQGLPVTPAPALKLPATYTPTVLSNATATWVIPNTPSRTPSPSATVAPTVTSSATPRPTPSPRPTLAPLTRIAAAESVRSTTVAEEYKTLVAIATQTPAALNTFELIDLDWMEGKIDIDHASVFKMFALFGGGAPRVPARYIVKVPINGEGTGLFLYALKDWEKLSPATQILIANFVTPREVTPVRQTPTPTQAPKIPLPGAVYTTNLTEQDNLPGSPPLSGRWEFDLSSGAVSLNGERVITRSINQQNDRVVFVDDYGSLACVPPGQEGTYIWHADGNSITFTLVDDPCDSRARVLTAHPRRKQ